MLPLRVLGMDRTDQVEPQSTTPGRRGFEERVQRCHPLALVPADPGVSRVNPNWRTMSDPNNPSAGNERPEGFPPLENNPIGRDAFPPPPSPGYGTPPPPPVGPYSPGAFPPGGPVPYPNAAMAPVAATNTPAIVALVCGLCSLFCFPLAIGALIAGFMGLSQSKQTGIGKGMSIAGIVLGGIVTVLAVLWVVLVMAVGVFGRSSSSYGAGAVGLVFGF